MNFFAPCSFASTLHIVSKCYLEKRIALMTCTVPLHTLCSNASSLLILDTIDVFCANSLYL